MKQKFNSSLILFGLTIIFASCTNNYVEGIKKYNEKNYDNALTYLKKVENTDENYVKSQIKISEIDSILTQIKIVKARQDSIAIVDKAKQDSILTQIKIEKARQNSIAIVEKAKQDSIARIEIEKKEFEDFKAQLNREIESFKTFDGSKYRDDVTSIQIEIVLFGAWAKIIKDAEKHTDKDINRLGVNLKSKVIILQKSEFPKLRKSYGEVLKQKLWTENIKVRAKDAGYTTLEFEGGIFANNKNKEVFQNTLSENEILNLLRFKWINYKWYEYDDDNTYYSLQTKPDGALVDI